MSWQTSGDFDKVAILDLGSQYTQLIARRIRELKVYSEIFDNTLTVDEIREMSPSGIVLSGGPNSVYQFGSPEIDTEIFELGIPILGICYGMQLIGKVFGVGITAANNREYGKTELTVTKPESALYAGLNPDLICWMSHGDITPVLPAGFIATSHTLNTPVASFENVERRAYGVQFHPEVTHTPWGKDLLSNFLYRICKAEPKWQMTDFIERNVIEIRQRVGSAKVICGLSGGVDSFVTAAIVDKAIGKQLECVFVDHGMMRLDEADEVEQAFNEHFQSKLIRVDASDRFLSKLDGETEPERKRKIIGEEFIRVFEGEAVKLENIRYLAQGTSYPDVIESSGIGLHAHVIKSHHNVGGLPERMNLELIEPLRDLFKDEIRALAVELGLPDAIAYRPPFPGPGLGIRIIGDVTRERIAILQHADAIIREEIIAANLYDGRTRAFGVLPAIKTTGVTGDARAYGYPIVIRAVTSDDEMTADWTRVPYAVLDQIANRVLNEVVGVVRTVLDITSKPPGTIEWE
ncbi:glutamine-hydrolyzing GMP synthase [bacterium]|nr:glutamine-hydrolyzing GMP synthase [bacterium]